MTLELYQLPFSPPCRNVAVLGKVLKLPIESKTVDLMTGENMKPEFLKINPFHCIPTLVDDGFSLWESRAIMTYLVDKFAPDSDLYPKNLQKRATVDRWLFWDDGTLYPALGAYYRHIFREGKKPDASVAQNFMDKMKLLDDSLATSKYLCGDAITLADISIMTTATTAPAVDLDISGFKNVQRWLKQLEGDFSSFWNELVTVPVEKFNTFIKSKLTA